MCNSLLPFYFLFIFYAYCCFITITRHDYTGTTGDPSTNDMNLLPVPLFAMSTDNTHFLTMKATSNGRIFLGARDGCLYEVLYQVDNNNTVYVTCSTSMWRLRGGVLLRVKLVVSF